MADGMLSAKIGPQRSNYLFGRGVKQVRLSRFVDLNISGLVILHEALAEVIIQAVFIAGSNAVIGITGAFVIKIEIGAR